MEFRDLGLDAELLRALDDAGYVIPTPIQEHAIPPALEGRDVLGLAQTGTGKTCAFALPILQKLKNEDRLPGFPPIQFNFSSSLKCIDYSGKSKVIIWAKIA